MDTRSGRMTCNVKGVWWKNREFGLAGAVELPTSTTLKAVLSKGKILELSDGSKWRVWFSHSHRPLAWSPGCAIEVYNFQKYLCTHSIYHVASKRAVGAIAFPEQWTFEDVEDWTEKLYSFAQWMIDGPT